MTDDERDRVAEEAYQKMVGFVREAVLPGSAVESVADDRERVVAATVGILRGAAMTSMVMLASVMENEREEELADLLTNMFSEDLGEAIEKIKRLGERELQRAGSSPLDPFEVPE